MSVERSYTVKGMTCSHCKASVTEEVEQVAGVSDIEVALESGLLTVRGEGFDDATIKAAVEQAGYEVVA